MSPEMHGEEGHVLSCDVGPRWQRRQKDKHSHKSFLKPVGGGSTFEFGECMSGDEALALSKGRPSSEHKMREMSGNHIFEGPSLVKENCGGVGSDITGICPAENLWVYSGRLQAPKPASSRATTSSRLSQTRTSIPHRRPCTPMSLMSFAFHQTRFIETQRRCRVNLGLEGRCAEIQRFRNRILLGQGRRCCMEVWKLTGIRIPNL